MSTPAMIDIQSKDIEMLDKNLATLGGKVPDILDAFVSERADILVKLLAQKSHKLSGDMSRSWRKEKVGQAHYIVTTDLDYPIYELNREGEKDGTPHDAMTASLEEYYSRYDDQLVKKYLNMIIKELFAGL